MQFFFYSPVHFEQWDWRSSVQGGIGGSELPNPSGIRTSSVSPWGWIFTINSSPRSARNNVFYCGNRNAILARKDYAVSSCLWKLFDFFDLLNGQDRLPVFFSFWNIGASGPHRIGAVLLGCSPVQIVDVVIVWVVVFMQSESAIKRHRWTKYCQNYPMDKELLAFSGRRQSDYMVASFISVGADGRPLICVFPFIPNSLFAGLNRPIAVDLILAFISGYWLEFFH